jgi:hypothetical protein
MDPIATREKTIIEHPNIQPQMIKNDYASAIPDYAFCSSISLNPELTYATEQELVGTISAIVETEAPIHFDELCVRIKDLAKIPRFNKKYKDRIGYYCKICAARNILKIHEKFLWPVMTPASILRRRKPDHGVDIEWICNEEINQAINLILKQQFATTKDDLIMQTLKIFGLKRQTEKAVLKISNVIDNKIKTTELEVRKDGMIDFRKEKNSQQ